jgi:hypothetical protein
MSGDGDGPVQKFIAAWEAAATVAAQWAEQTSAAATDTFRKLTKDPAIAAVLETWRVGPVWARRYCGCPCVRSHPDDPEVCDGHAVITRRLATDRDGEVDMPLCAPCAVAQGVAEQAG